MTGRGATAAVGVICHLDNPDGSDVASLARAAEDAGAQWLGLPDAFWWRDTWMLAAEAARATSSLTIGPVVTNPYLRHPFHTIAACATLQDLAGPRVQLGLGAGGSELRVAAGVDRSDARSRILELVALVRGVAAGDPLDPVSGRRLDVPLTRPPVLVAGRADRVLHTAGRCADRALLWAVPSSDLERSAGLVSAGAIDRVDGAGPGPTVVWAPLAVHDDADRARARVISAYGILNASPQLRRRWEIDDAHVADIRQALVGGGPAAAVDLVPPHVVDDVALTDLDPDATAAVARRIGATELAVPAHDIASLPARVAWARSVVELGDDG